MTTPLACLIVAAILPYVWSTWSATYRVREFGRELDNKNPRAQQALLKGAGGRAYAAQQNAWEALGLFTAGVVVSHLAGAPAGAAAALAVVFVIARILHGLFYVWDQDMLRSAAFGVGAPCVLGLFGISFF